MIIVEILKGLTGLGAVITAIVAVVKFFNDQKETRKEKIEQRFNELTKRASSSFLLELINAISVLPIFAENKKIKEKFKSLNDYYDEFNRKCVYLNETIDIIFNLLISNAHNTINVNDEIRKQIDGVCGEAISKITHKTLKMVNNKPTSYIKVHNRILNNISLPYVYLKGSNFQNAKLSKTDFHKADFSYCNLSETKLNNANLHKAKFNYSNLSKADLSNAFINQYGDITEEAVFEKTVLEEVLFKKTLMEDLKFFDCNFHCTELDEAKAKFSKFINCNLTRIDCYKSDLQDIEFNNCDFKEAAFIRCDLSGAKFVSGKNFEEITLKDSNIWAVKFVKFDISKIIFTNCICDENWYKENKSKINNYAFEKIATAEEIERLIAIYPSLEHANNIGYLR